MPITQAEKTDRNQKVLYWSKAERFQLGGFIKEKRNEQNIITQPDMSIDFNAHIYATDDPKKQKYIEESRPFKIGQIKRCKDENEATMHTMSHNNARAGVVKVKNLMDRDVYSRPERQ